MTSRTWFAAAAMAVLLLGASRTDALETDPLWAAICAQPHDDAGVQLVSAAIPQADAPPLAPCAAEPASFHPLPAAGGRGTDVSVTLEVGFDRATSRLCYVNRKLPEAPVIRVSAGHRLTIGLTNTLRDDGPDHSHNCPIQTYTDGGPCVPRPQFRAAPGLDGNFYPIQANMPHNADGSTNLHVHGLHVSPLPCHDEVLHSALYPANFAGAIAPLLPCQSGPGQLTYSYDIPADHPAGLFWYHAHRHGQAEPSTQMGLAGAIVIEDAGDAWRESLGVADQVLMVRDQPFGGGGAARRTRRHAAAASQAAIDPHIDRSGEVTCGPDDSDGGGPQQTQLTLNNAPVPEAAGGAFPPDAQLLSTVMAPGQRQLWRILNAAADTYIAPRLVLRQGAARTVLPLEVVARDGTKLVGADGRPHIGWFDVTADPLLLAPGNRLEIVVHAPPAGAVLYLESAKVHPGCAGDGDPARRLLMVTASGTATTAAAAVDDLDIVAQAPAPVIADAAPSVRRTFVFSEYARDFTVAHTRWLDGAPQPGQFDPDATDFFITQTAASDGQAGAVAQIPFTAHNLRPQVTVHLHGADSVTEEWTIQNATLEVHAFHIHQMSFHDVTAVNGTPDQRPVLDVVNVPAAQNVDGVPGAPGVRRLRLTFTKAMLGEFVYHCHVLEHEDNGMMGKVRVVARLKPDVGFRTIGPLCGLTLRGVRRSIGAGRNSE